MWTEDESKPVGRLAEGAGQGFVYWTLLATLPTRGFCNLVLKGFNEAFIWNSVISGLGWPVGLDIYLHLLT